MRVRLFFFLAVMILFSALSAQETQQPVLDKEYYSLANRLSLKMGGGLTFALLDADFSTPGIFQGNQVDKEKVSFETKENLALNAALKYNFSNYLSFGVSCDYNVVSVDEMNIEADWNGNSVNVYGDFDDVRVLSVCGFLEARFSFSFGSGVLAPYLQVGVGMNKNMPRFDEDILSLDNKTNLSVVVAGGLEYFVNDLRNVSFFLEWRWHYNKVDYTYYPQAGTKFEGTMDLSNVAFLMGFSVHFG